MSTAFTTVCVKITRRFNSKFTQNVKPVESAV